MSIEKSPEWVHPIGRCRNFCPQLEVKRRQSLKLLHVLEVDGSGQSAGACVVKEYVRAGAGHLIPSPTDLRPARVLLDTMQYLVTRVVDRTDHPWYVIYEFVNNRIQAIRQDITYQALVGADVHVIFQLACRFYLYSHYRLWTHPQDKFDPHLNQSQLQQCLVKTVRTENSGQVCRDPEQEAEFEAYYMLTNLGNYEVMNHILSLRRNIRSHPLVQSAMAISINFTSNNFVRCCRLILQLPPLHKAAVLPHMYHIRRQALQTMCSAYSCKTGSFPLSTLCKWLLIEDVLEGTELCTAHGILVKEECAHFRKGCFRLPCQGPPQVTMKISQFYQPHHASLYIVKK